MRRLLLAVVLLTGPLTGCTFWTEDEVSIEQPSPPTGLLLTYEITQNGTTTTETFLAFEETAKGTDLLAYDLSRQDFSSPFLAFKDNFNPRRFNWSNVFEYPLEPGDSNDARVGGADATIEWSKVDYDGPLETDTALEGVARTPSGEVVARFQLPDIPSPVITYIEVDAPDGTNETWTLLGATFNDGWDRPPAWELGDWWTYEGVFKGNEGNSQIVYAGNTSTRRAEQYVLSPRTVDDRTLMLPFQKWRKGDVAPQSGFVTSLMSSFWQWPLQEGKTWTGQTSSTEGSENYQAIAHMDRRIPLPDGSVSVGFSVEAFVQGDEEPFAQFTYSPRVEHLVDWRMSQVGTNFDALNFTLQDWGERFHGEMEIPKRGLVERIPRNGSLLTGPETINRTFEVPDRANRLQVTPQSFAVHKRNADPVFEMRLIDPNGTLRYEKNDTMFEDRRLDLAEVINAEPGTWRLELRAGNDVSMLAQIFANWFEVREIDFR